MSRPFKRARGGGAVARVARPIDKELKVANQLSTTSVTSTVLKTTTFPGTVVGLRWNLAIVNALSTGNSLTHWAVVVIPDGEAANTPSTSDGADFYTPEQNVLAFGVTRTSDTDGGVGPLTVHVEGTTKTMRKLKQGDVLAFISLCGSVNGAQIDGVLQFFFKT